MADPFIAHEPRVTVADDGKLILFVPLVGTPDTIWPGAFGLVSRVVPAMHSEATVSEHGVTVVLPPDVADGAVWRVLDWVRETIPVANEAWAARQRERERVAGQVSAWWRQHGGE